MRFDILTLFPGLFDSVFAESIVQRAVAGDRVEINIHNIRDYAMDKHHVTDDTPYGGGGGMVMKVEPIARALEAILDPDLLARQKATGETEVPVILLTPVGRRFDQQLAQSYERYGHIVLICGRYESVDQRVSDLFVTDEVSLGDFVLSGGEIAAMAIVEAVTRIVPGVLGDMRAIIEDSHASGLLEYPHYTRPPVYRGLAVPDILLSGHHARIEEWRRRQALKRTWKRRPDLLEEADLGRRDRQFLRSLQDRDEPEA